MVSTCYENEWRQFICKHKPLAHKYMHTNKISKYSWCYNVGSIKLCIYNVYIVFLFLVETH